MRPHGATLMALAALVSLTITACGEQASGGSGGVEVVASTTVTADLARNVVGERASVTSLLAPNSDPHDYEPAPSDATALAEADLIVGSGGDVDLWLAELVESSGSDAPRLELIDAAETIPADADAAAAAQEADPHWWQDPRNAILAVAAIRDELIAIDPQAETLYRRNTAAYVSRLESLDAQITTCMQQVPDNQLRLVTSHDALGYFAERYGIEVVGSTIPALSTQAQPSAGEIAELVDLIEAQHVEAVFPEVGVDADLEQAVADEAGASIGGELYADTLGSEESSGSTYLGSLASNAKTMVAGFTNGAQSCEIGVAGS